MFLMDEKMKNKFVLVTIAILVLFAWNLTASDFTIEKHDDQTCTIMEYNGSKRILDIPSHIEGYKVVSIGDLAFLGCESLSSITIPDSVTSIGVGAFYSCSALASITVGLSNPVYASLEGVLFNKIDKSLHMYPIGKELTKYSVPEGTLKTGDSALSGSFLATRRK